MKTIEQPIKEFYKKNNFDEDGGINKSFTWIKFGFFSVPVPNVESRKYTIFFHDVNHLITQNDTSWKGESAVSAWEVASGGWKNYWVPWLLTLWALGLGILFYWKSTRSAFEDGLSMHNSLISGISKSEIKKLSLYELQTKLKSNTKRTTSFMFWLVIGLLVFLFPFFLVITFSRFVIGFLE